MAQTGDEYESDQKRQELEAKAQEKQEQAQMKESWMLEENNLRSNG